MIYLTTINGALNATDQTFTATDGSKFPQNIECDILVDEEDMHVSSVSSNTITVSRGYNKTTAATHADGAQIFIYLDEKFIYNLLKVVDYTYDYPQHFQNTDTVLTTDGVTHLISSGKMLSTLNVYDGKLIYFWSDSGTTSTAYISAGTGNFYTRGGEFLCYQNDGTTLNAQIVGTSPGRVYLYNGSGLVAYSDDGTTMRLYLDGATGNIDMRWGGDLILRSNNETIVASIDGATGNITTSGTVDGVDIAAHAVANTGVHGIGASTFATAATLATHAALDTGVHGAGANTLATDADIDADVATHAALTATHGVAGTIADVSDIAVDANLSVAAQAVVTAGACDVDANLSVAAQAVVTAGACDVDANLSAAAQAIITNGLVHADVDDTPVNGETTVPISSNWAYDHNAAILSSTVHGNTYLAKAYLANTVTDTPNAAIFKIPLDTELYDLGNNFSVAQWYSSICQAGSGATTIMDGAVTFTEAVRYSKVSWHDGYGFISSIFNPNILTIVTVNGNAINEDDTYTINHAEYTVPANSYLDIKGGISYANIVANQRYLVFLQKYTGGAWVILDAGGGSAAVAATHYPKCAIEDYFLAGDLIALFGYHTAGVTTVDIGGAAGFPYTSLSISLKQGA